MAKREVLDEEPIDLDLGDDVEEFVDLTEDGEIEDEEEPPKKRVKGALTDEDLDDYEKKVRELNERTQAAEAAAREAADVATAAVTRLEQASSGNAKKQLEEQKANIGKQVASLRKELKNAFEEGDADKHAELTEKLADLKGQERLLLVAEEQFKQQEKQPKQPARPQPHAKAQAWLKENPWFNTNEEARMAAVMYGNMLERSGVSPATDTYYQKVNEHMKKRYPELYDEEDNDPPRRESAPPVRGVDRATPGGAKKRSQKVKLTPLQVKIARQWNIPPEEMAKEVLNQRKRDQGMG